MKSLVAIALVALTGCATTLPTSAKLEFEHASHPGVGFPFADCDGCEDQLNTINGILTWKTDSGWYGEGYFGRNLKGRDGGGFRGPAFTSGVRFGKEFKIREPR